MLTTRFPYLKLLDLENATLVSKVFRAFVNAHVRTLRELRVRNLYIEDDCSWEEIAWNLSKSLQLNFVSLHSMTDEAGYLARGAVCLGAQRSLVVAMLFTGWLPDYLISYRECRPCGAIAWHKDNLLPDIDLDSV